MNRQPVRRYFAFLYPDDPVIQQLLDLAIFILNPAEKLSAHVTIAGPYREARQLPTKTSFFRKVCLTGVGQFRSEGQNTVYVGVEATDLRDIWDKPDYPYNPHLTLYDGDDPELADRLYDALFRVRLIFRFYVSKVTHVATTKGQGDLELASKVNLTLLPELRKKTLSDVKRLSREERILYAVEAIKRVKFYSLRSEIPTIHSEDGEPVAAAR